MSRPIKKGDAVTIYMSAEASMAVHDTNYGQISGTVQSMPQDTGDLLYVNAVTIVGGVVLLAINLSAASFEGMRLVNPSPASAATLRAALQDIDAVLAPQPGGCAQSQLLAVSRARKMLHELIK